jgi:hypothetical protein
MIDKKIRKTTKLGIALASLVFIAMPLTVSAANTTINVSVTGVISTFTTSGTVTLGALAPDATGRQSTNNDVVTVSTNDADGFTLTLEDADATRTLASGGNSFAASAGTPASPVTLVNNTWGWRVDDLSGFGAGPTATIANTAPSALTYAGIPANASAFTLLATAGTGSEVTDVWYSARANDTQPTGTYTDTVTYTATVN